MEIERKKEAICGGKRLADGGKGLADGGSYRVVRKEADKRRNL